MKTRIPPRFVNIRSDELYDTRLSSPLLTTYARLSGLAWQDSANTNLPPMEISELCRILGIELRSFWGHLKALKAHGLLTYISQHRMIRVTISRPQVSVQNIALNDDDDEPFVNHLEIQDHQHHQPKPVRKIALDPLPDTLREQLGTLGWTGSLRKVLSLYAESPDLVEEWLAYALRAPKVANRAGLLRSELRSGSRPPILPPEPAQAQAAAVEEELPVLPEWEYPQEPTWDLWEKMLGILKQEHPNPSWMAYLQSVISLELQDDILLVGVESQYQASLLTSRFSTSINRILSGMLNERISTRFILAEPEIAR